MLYELRLLRQHDRLPHKAAQLALRKVLKAAKIPKQMPK